jgi:asparagine synthase (glutamine-hydrolysing)
MSGFFGVVRDSGEPFNPATYQKFAERLEFRGGGTTNVWTRPGSGLGYAAFQSPSRSKSENRPATLNSREWIVGDIRLDDKKHLAGELGLSRSDETHADCDNKMLLRAWQKWGPDCLPEILGDFSFALWDNSENTLWCARDFIGARPFFYAMAEGDFYFSNTLRSLCGLPGISAELDPVFIGDFLLAGHCPDLSRTVYRDIHRLPPGYRLKYHRGKVEVERFLALPIEEPLYLKRIEEYLDAYLELLRQAVADRLPQNPTALYLSGGLDSGSVCAIAAELVKKQARPDALKAFTMSWQTLFDDPEPRFATMTAKHLGLAHEILEEPEVLPLEIPFATPEPWAELYGGRSHKQCLRVAQYSSVVLAGEGGDDVLNGQAWPYLQNLGGRGEWVRMMRTFGGFLLSHGRFPPLRGGFRARLRGAFRGEQLGEQFPNWIAPELEQKANLRQRFRELNRPALREHPNHPAAYAALQSGYWSGFLETEDAGWTGVALESRAPLLDLRLLRFLLRLPPVPWCVNKELARKATQPYLPRAIIQRPKTTLVRDPVEAAQTKRGWRPDNQRRPSAQMESFVNWSSWNETLESAKGLLSWDNLRPPALERWLKDIENE